MINNWRILTGDVREILAGLPSASARCCVTSPPYWGLRDYGVSGQLGLESTPEAYVAAMVGVFQEVRRVLADDGTLWLNLGDSYCSVDGGQRQGQNGQMANRSIVRARAQVRDSKAAAGMGAPQRPPSIEGVKPKDLVGIPWLVAFALRADGWYLRSDIIWSKPNPMPESVTDRPTKSHEYIFLLSKSRSYYYDADAIAEATLWPDGPNSPESIKSPYGQGFTRRNVDGVHLQEPVRVADLVAADDGRLDSTAVHHDDNSQPAGRARLLRQYRRKNIANARGGSGDDTGRGPGRGDGGAPCNKRGQLTRNKRSVWNVATQPYPDAHFATFPETLIEPCILAGSAHCDTVLDPFTGSGTTGAVAIRHQRNFVGCELNPKYVQLARERIGSIAPMFAQEVA